MGILRQLTRRSDGTVCSFPWSERGFDDLCGFTSSIHGFFLRTVPSLSDASGKMLGARAPFSEYSSCLGNEGKDGPASLLARGTNATFIRCAIKSASGHHQP